MVSGMMTRRSVYPGVPRNWLFAIAGTIWILAGLVLVTRATGLLSSFTLGVSLSVALGGIALATVGYAFAFSRAVEKNIRRIHGLPDPACAFAFMAWSGYLIIALMMTMGILLTDSSLPRLYLSILYTAMGGMLLAGGARLFRQFAMAGSQTQ